MLVGIEKDKHDGLAEIEIKGTKNLVRFNVDIFYNCLDM